MTRQHNLPWISFVVLFVVWLNGTVFGACKDASLDADVMFVATVIGTNGADTEMELIEVIKGQIGPGQITFKHAVQRNDVVIGTATTCYVLRNGHTYQVLAKKTSRRDVFSQLWGSNYCGDSVTIRPLVRK
jgi:hypothetical protein